VTEETHLDSDAHFWYYHLEQLNDELDMGLNFTGWTTGRSRRPLLGMYPLYGAVLTSNTDLVGTKVVHGDADTDGIDDPSMNATRHNLTSSHQENGSLPTNTSGTVVAETTADHSTVVAMERVAAHNRASRGSNATRAHTARSRHHNKHLRKSAEVLNIRTVSSSEPEIASNA
jgi:hypothetical protein